MSTQPVPAQVRTARHGRWMRRIGALLVVLVALACVCGVVVHGWLHRSFAAALPQLDGSLRVAGLSAPVRVERDAHGIPHITAATMDDLIFAQAFVTAQDRLWQMDMLRRHSSGELAAVLGSKLVEHDKTQRYLQLRATADRSIPDMDPAERHQLERYAEGVNAAIRAIGDHLPAEFKLLGYRPAPWTARDSLLVGFAMAEDLSTIYPEKLNREAFSAEVQQPDLLADLYPVGSFRDHPPDSGTPAEAAPQQSLSEPDDDTKSSELRAAAHRGDLLAAWRTLKMSVSSVRCEGCAAGSNNWVVGGSRTASGKPLLANDMHLSVTLPGIWYTAELQGPGFHCSGVTLPGVPFVIVGHNEHVAWGFTNSGADVQDVYVEQIQGDRYRASDGTDRPLEHMHEHIAVKHGFDLDLDIPLTLHGAARSPVISGLFPKEQRALALRWTLFEPGFASQPFARVNSARNTAELVASFERFAGPSQNVVYADDAGHIGYHLLGWVPLRGDRGHSGIPPVPVPAGSYEWAGFIPYAALPHTDDPASGIIGTANARITPDDYPYPIALDWELPYRNEEIWRFLGAGKQLTAASMTALQNDVTSAFDRTVAERVSYAVDHAKNPSQRAKKAADLLRNWDGEIRGDSAAANITEAVRLALLPMLLEPHLSNKEFLDLYTWRSRSYALEVILKNEPARWLPPSYSDWNEFLAAVLERGFKDSHAPSALNTWTWSTTHTTRLDHPVFGSSWLLRALSGNTGSTELPVPGNAFTVHVSNGVHSASERFVADLADLPASTMTLPQGESADVQSPWYLDQWPYWVAGKALPLPFATATTAGASTTHSLTLLP